MCVMWDVSVSDSLYLLAQIHLIIEYQPDYSNIPPIPDHDSEYPIRQLDINYIYDNGKRITVAGNGNDNNNNNNNKLTVGP